MPETQKVEVQVEENGSFGPLTLSSGGAYSVVLVYARKTVHMFHPHGLLFETDREIMIPRLDDASPDINALDTVRALLDYLREHDGYRVTALGHTDESGSEKSNDALSDRRAESVQYYLAGDRAGWAAHAEANQTVADWQCVLSWAAETLDWACHPGPVDNDLGPATASALSTFRERCNEEFGQNLPLDGPFTSGDWEGVFNSYDLWLSGDLGIEQEALADERARIVFTDPPLIACGERYPAPTEGDGQGDKALDRRVDLVLCEEADLPYLTRKPPGEGIYGDSCTRLFLPVEPREVQPLGHVFFQLLSEMGQEPIPDFELTLRIGGRRISCKTDENGVYDGEVILMSRYELLIGDGSILAPAIELDDTEPYPLYFFPELTEEARLATGSSEEDEALFDNPADG